MKLMKHYGEKFQLIKELINKEDPLIVEVGAHYGEDTLRFLETFPNANIHCFEPDDRNINIFNKIVSFAICPKINISKFGYWVIFVNSSKSYNIGKILRHHCFFFKTTK